MQCSSAAGEMNILWWQSRVHGGRVSQSCVEVNDVVEIRISAHHAAQRSASWPELMI